MAKWIYTLDSGLALREAIDECEYKLVAENMLKCLEELTNKLSDDDRAWKGWDIEDLAENINGFLGSYTEYSDDEQEEMLDDYLHDFYDICDDVRAWIEI